MDPIPSGISLELDYPATSYLAEELRCKQLVGLVIE